MAAHFFSTVEDVVTGKPVTGATVLIYEAGATISGDAITSGTLATVFSDDGITTINQSSNPITTDSRGFWEFWTEETSVCIEISYGGVAKKAITDVDLIGGSVSSDVTALQVRLDAVELITQDAFVVSLAALSDPNADRILFWDDSASNLAFLELGSGLSITGTTLSTSGFLQAANNLSDVGSAATARTNLSVPKAAQTGEAIAVFIASPSNKDYTLVLKAPHGGTITETTTKSASGTCTATFKVNTTALGGTANSVSSSEQSQAHSSANTFAAGDDIVLTVSSNSSCVDLAASIKYTRTLES